MAGSGPPNKLNPPLDAGLSAVSLVAGALLLIVTIFLLAIASSLSISLDSPLYAW